MIYNEDLLDVPGHSMVTSPPPVQPDNPLRTPSLPHMCNLPYTAWQFQKTFEYKSRQVPYPWDARL